MDEACSTHGGIVRRRHEEEGPITINLRVRDRMGFKSGVWSCGLDSHVGGGTSGGLLCRR